MDSRFSQKKKKKKKKMVQKYRSRQWHTPNNNRHCCNVAMFPGWFGPK
jgi:hypothetical protein